MAEYLISNQQLQLIHNKIFDENRVQEAKVAWESFSDEQKNLVYTIYESLYPSEKKVNARRKDYMRYIFAPCLLQLAPILQL